MVGRLLAVTSIALAALSPAALIQVWDKSFSSVGFRGATIDSSGNVYGVGSTTNGYVNTVIVKVSPAGSTLWTKTIPVTAQQLGKHILLDAFGNAYVSVETYEGKIYLKKIRTSDGASLGSLTFDDVNLSEYDTGGLIADKTGQIFFVFERWDLVAHTGQIGIAKVDAANFNLTTTNFFPIPPGSGFLDVEPRAAGIAILLGTKAIAWDPFNEYDTASSSVFIYDGNAVTSAVPLGLASRIALWADDSVYGFGSDTTDFYVTHALANTPTIDEWMGTVNTGAGFVRDVVLTKNKSMIAAGGASGSSTIWKVNPESGLAFEFRKSIPGTANPERLDWIKKDGYFGLYALETNRGASPSRVLEIDELTGEVVDSRTYNYLPYGFATNASGLTVFAGSNNLVLLKPRDLKDIYMASTTMTGGNSASLTIRMYETYGNARTVNLTDNSPNLSLPASKTVAGATSTASVIVTTTPVAVPELATITATYGTQTRIFRVTINP